MKHMLKSMTAYTYREKTRQNFNVSIEIRTYNSRHLDFVVRIPNEYISIEARIKKMVSARISRGRIEIRLKIKDDSENGYAFDVDVVKARAFHKSLMELKDLFDISAGINMDLFINSGQVIKPCVIERDVEADWSMIKVCLEQAIEDIDNMRLKEGSFIESDLAERINNIGIFVDKIEDESAKLVSLYHGRLKERISLLTEGAVELDQTRLAQEAAILADKSDISEELVRARSHIQQFNDIMAADESAGKKLDFLLQEMNREFNTISSKSGGAEVSHIVVDVKSELEKIREQVQNLE